MTTTNGQHATDDQTTKPAPKAKKAKATKKTAKPTWTLTETALAYLESLKAARKSESTINAYAADLDLATEVLGAETPIAAITPADVERFNESEPVLRTKSGRDKAQPTIDRSRRVLRLALTFAEQQGAIDAAPIEAKTRAKKDMPLSQREVVGNDDARIYPSADPSDPAVITYASNGEQASA
jgi:site-specific recombinase XerD